MTESLCGFVVSIPPRFHHALLPRLMREIKLCRTVRLEIGWQRAENVGFAEGHGVFVATTILPAGVMPTFHEPTPSVQPKIKFVANIVTTPVLV